MDGPAPPAAPRRRGDRSLEQALKLGDARVGPGQVLDATGSEVEAEVVSGVHRQNPPQSVWLRGVGGSPCQCPPPGPLRATVGASGTRNRRAHPLGGPPTSGLGAVPADPVEPDNLDPDADIRHPPHVTGEGRSDTRRAVLVVAGAGWTGAGWTGSLARLGVNTCRVGREHPPAPVRPRLPVGRLPGRRADRRHRRDHADTPHPCPRRTRDDGPSGPAWRCGGCTEPVASRPGRPVQAPRSTRRCAWRATPERARCGRVALSLGAGPAGRPEQGSRSGPART